MLIIHQSLIPPPGYDAINLFGVLFCRRNVHLSAALIRHERIHTAQMLELGILPFYLWYVVEWGIRLLLPGRAYKNISFEREAYAYMYDEAYLLHRPHYGWWRFLMSV